MVDAPLQVHLKRKHWAGQEKSASERCKEVFLKQMQQAQQRMEPAAGGPAGPAGPGAGRQLRDEGVAVGGPAAGAPKKAGKKDAGGKGQAKQQQQQQQQDKKGKKRKAPMVSGLGSRAPVTRRRSVQCWTAAKAAGTSTLPVVAFVRGGRVLVGTELLSSAAAPMRPHARFHSMAAEVLALGTGGATRTAQGVHPSPAKHDAPTTAALLRWQQHRSPAGVSLENRCLTLYTSVRPGDTLFGA